MKRYTAGTIVNGIKYQFGEYNYLQDALCESESTLDVRVYIQDNRPNNPKQFTYFEFENGKLVRILATANKGGSK